MIDVTRETVVSLVDVARRLNVTVKTVRNWAVRQVGPQLETAKFGGKVVTTWEAVQRFGSGRGKKQQRVAPSATRQHEASMRRLKEVHGI